jgi:aminoglycoside phosphotransferase (APT) family kinase protein
LHTSAARAAAAARLPDRGPGHFREHLRSARAKILTSLVNPALGADDVAVLQTVLSQCEILELRWNQIERICEGMPQTLVHGDFKRNNAGVRTSEAGSVLLPFDWGKAGWGVPAIDLARSPLSIPGFSGAPEIAIYWAGIRDHWPGFDLPTVQQWADVGTMFRSLAAVNWEAVNLALEWVENTMMKLRIYQATMADAMQATGWGHDSGS